MSHHQQSENVEMYVLGGLTDEEQQTFEDHLQSCSECQEKVREFQDVVGLLPLTSEPVEPPPGMKDRVLGHVLGDDQQDDVDEDQERATPSSPVKTSARRSHWGRFGVIGVSAAALLLGIFSVQQQGQINELQQELAATENELEDAQTDLLATEEQLSQTQEELDEAVVSLDDPMQFNDVVELAPAAEDIVAEGLATIVVDSDGTHLMVQADDMPELEGNEAFQVWLMEDGQPVNAGTFHTEAGQGALHYTFEQDNYDTIAITLEPDADGDEPRGDMILAAELTEEL
ncbi:anti-sigma factor [Natribacillus halophilus]|uniref:Anti-sigma-W factor RsiW n=1 Tax=Natribacillus halophilus TaxID=549003 RepID=A0A1G8KWT7_9BACI|nr:anti-sigma factor [Natribacillus halophilus]SDI47846.1 Putative zinc-finger [Natribacillus halophilus]